MAKARLIPESEYRVVPWKNGGGTTAQIAIWPREAEFSSGRFDWRVSRATVQEDGLFSVFPEHDRLLAILQGRMRLHYPSGESAELGPGDLAHFSGKHLVRAEVLSGPVQDLGLIYRHPSSAQMSFHRLKDRAGIQLPSFAGVLYVAEGTVRVGEGAAAIEVPAGASFLVSEMTSIFLTSGQNTSFATVWALNLRTEMPQP